jgi:regulation of enolase protein 1 (concanavalin A-like superfamily)/dienelactone hydrolase
MHIRPLVCRLALVLALASPLAARADIVNGFDVWNIDYGNDGVDIPGRLYIPANYNPANSYPLVIFYHGMGQRGSDNRQQVESQINELIAAAGSRNFFIYAPQLGTGAQSWWDGYLDQTTQGVAATMGKYNIDRRKIYVTGLSLGGGAVRSVISRYYSVVAAAVPICGLPRTYASEFPFLVGKPIWQFHAVNDNTVSVDGSRNHVNAIRAADGNKPPLSFPLNAQNGQPYRNNGEPYYPSWSGHTYYAENGLRYTEYGNGDHFIWGWVYGDSNMYDWLLAQQLPEPALQPGETASFDFGLTAAASGTDSQGRLWNSITSWSAPNSYTAVAPFVQIGSGRRTSVSLTVEQRFGGPFDVASGVATSLYPDQVGKDGWITQANATATTNTGVMRICGLEAGAAHRVEIFGSIADNDWGSGRQTRYQIGSETRDVDAYNNTATKAIFEGVTADSLGTIQVKVYGKPGTTTSKAVINALTVTRSGSSAPSNAAPIVNAGADQTVTLYDGVTLSGTATDDGLPSGSTVSKQWSKESGPGTVTFNSGTSLQTTAAFSDPGTYVLKLSASDSLLTGSDLVTIVVNEWKNLDIGTVPVAGSGSVSQGMLTVNGSGASIWKNEDDFQFMFRPVQGDCSIIARQLSHPYQHWASKAGIMIRESLGRDASHVFVGMDPGGVNSTYMDHNQGLDWSGAGHSIGTVPYWLKLVRVGNTITTSISPDGQVWVELSTKTFPALASTVYVGFGVSSATSSALTATFDSITVNP